MKTKAPVAQTKHSATKLPAPRSLVIRASAGTGKTFQLTNCLLRLLLSGTSPRAILATTFTRKAAGEILNRVLERLAKATASEIETKKLANELGVAIASRENVVALLARLLRQIDQLRVSTLDSYFQQAAQSFAFELGLPFGWDVLEEGEITQLQSDAIRRVLRESSPSEIVNLMHLLDQGDLSWRVASQIRNTIEATHKAFLRSTPEAWKYVQPGEGMTEDAYTAALSELEALEPSKPSLNNEREVAIDAAKKGEVEYFLKTGVGKKLLQGETTYSRVEIPEAWADVYRKFIAHAQARALTWIAKKNEATADLVSKFETQYQIAKRLRRQYEFDDIPRKLAAALNSPESHRQLAFRLDSGVDHLLLDEFQDTSAEQWRVLAPTAHRVCETGKGEFLCVGDVKQAIYGWRGGSAEIFGAIEKQLDGVTVEHLVQSYRSAPEVIGAVNQVMEKLTSFCTESKDSTGLRDWATDFKTHSTAKKDLAGWVTLREVAPVEDAGGPGKAKLQAALLASADLAEQTHNQSPQHSIAILFRSNDPISRMVTLLRQRGIDASEEGGTSLLDSAAVETILSLIQLADHPGDSVARFHLETGPLRDRLANALVTPPLFAAELRRSLLADGYGSFVRAWSAKLAPSCTLRDAGRLQQLIEIASDYNPRATLRPRDFVNHIKKTRIKDVAVSAVRVMTIHQSKGLEFDTVILPELEKKFKGREPKCVAGADDFLAPATRATRWVEESERLLLPTEMQADHDRDRDHRVEESLCTLYVAMTRAIHALHMIVPEVKSKSSSHWSDLLRAALTKEPEANDNGLLYSSGDSNWHLRSLKPAAELAAVVTEESDWPTIAFNAKTSSTLRNLSRRKPSQAATEKVFNPFAAFGPKSTPATRFGTAIHYWFEHLIWAHQVTATTPDELFAKGIAVPGDDLAAWRARFEMYLKLPSVRELLDETAFRAKYKIQGELLVYNEKSIVFREEDALITGQIDRLVFEMVNQQPTRAWIIDFKTDAIETHSKSALAERIAHHTVQLQAYTRGIAKNYHLPQPAVEAYLVMLEPGVASQVLNPA